MTGLDHTARVVLSGCALIGLLGGVLGVFVVLRRQSLVGDVVSHAALPGIVLAFWLLGSRAAPVLAAGAIVAGLAGMLVVTFILRHSHIREDGALGLVLAGFFGLGVMLLTWIQGRPDAAQAGLDRYLFGSAASLLVRDLWWMGGAALAVVGVLVLLWKVFALTAFDPDFAAQLGWPTVRLDFILTLLTVLVIVLGLQTVGVVLMSALLVAPAVAARQWTDRLGAMTLLAALAGALAGLLGGWASLTVERMPTGPAIVLAAALLVALSLLASPRRGLLGVLLARRRARRGGEALPAGRA
ncbi:MAG: iron chelate uptake ABC transporter family permease subunit [bacterium]|nr:iron chelate uptake ABC transporter family permease subunit [bacterium]